MEIGRCKKTFVAKIHDSAGAASSSLRGESACTHQGARDTLVGCVVGTTGEDPKMASGGRRCTPPTWCHNVPRNALEWGIWRDRGRAIPGESMNYNNKHSDMKSDAVVVEIV